MAGRVRDPLVGRDALIGTLCGTAAALPWHVSYFVSKWIVGWQSPFYGGVGAPNSAHLIPAELLNALGVAIDRRGLDQPVRPDALPNRGGVVLFGPRR